MVDTLDTKPKRREQTMKKCKQCLESKSDKSYWRGESTCKKCIVKRELDKIGNNKYEKPGKDNYLYF